MLLHVWAKLVHDKLPFKSETGTGQEGKVCGRNQLYQFSTVAARRTSKMLSWELCLLTSKPPEGDLMVNPLSPVLSSLPLLPQIFHSSSEFPHTEIFLRISFSYPLWRNRAVLQPHWLYSCGCRETVNTVDSSAKNVVNSFTFYLIQAFTLKWE